MILAKPKRITNRAYLKWVKSFNCAMSSPECVLPVDPHHTTPVSLGGSDYTAIPLCRKHHDEVHQHPEGNKTFYTYALKVMADLWKEHQTKIQPRTKRERQQKLRPRNKRQVLRAYVLLQDNEFSLPVFESFLEGHTWRIQNGKSGRIVRCQVRLEGK